MPIPIYLICSESGAFDQDTKLASIFNIIERMEIIKFPTSPGHIAVAAMVPLRMSSYWMKEDTDPAEARFEVQFVAIFPNGPPEIELARGEFSFSGPFQRFNVVGLRLAHFFGPGILRLEARIRRAGEQGWLGRMIYPIVLEEIQVPQGVALPTQSQRPDT